MSCSTGASGRTGLMWRADIVQLEACESVRERARGVLRTKLALYRRTPTPRDRMARVALCDPTEGTFSRRAITVTAQRAGPRMSTSRRTMVFDLLDFVIVLNLGFYPGVIRRPLVSWRSITVAWLIPSWV